jgi:hypothetical protein
VPNTNIKAIAASTWKAINLEVIGYAEDQKMEKGREVRIDCTVVERNIYGSDQSMLVRWKGGGDTSGNSVCRPAGEIPARSKLSPADRK